MKATELLKRQHREVEDLFERALKSDEPAERRDLCGDIAAALQQHTQLEEEIFYPAVRETAKSKKMEKQVLEAYEEHHVVDLVLAELPQVDPEDERYEAKLTVLKELVEHHVEEEEDEMFPAAEKAFRKERSEQLAVHMRARLNGGADDAALGDSSEREREKSRGKRH